MKNGALSLDVNPVGRGLVFLSNLCLVFVRMNFIVFFMYSCGPGQFYPGVVAILVHTFLMGSLHIWFVDYDTTPFTSSLNPLKRCKMFLNFALSFLVNGLANIYCHNYVDTKTEQKTKCFMKKIPSFKRQSVFDMVFLLENIAIAIRASLDDQIPVKPFDDFHARSQLFAWLFFIHFTGLSLKLIYYKFFHIWKDVTTRFDFQSRSFYREDEKVELGFACPKLKNTASCCRN